MRPPLVELCDCINPRENCGFQISKGQNTRCLEFGLDVYIDLRGDTEF